MSKRIDTIRECIAHWRKEQERAIDACDPLRAAKAAQCAENFERQLPRVDFSKYVVQGIDVGEPTKYLKKAVKK